MYNSIILYITVYQIPGIIFNEMRYPDKAQRVVFLMK